MGQPRLAQSALADDQASLHELGLMPEDESEPRSVPADATPRKSAKRKRSERDAASDLSSASVSSFADSWDKFYDSARRLASFS